MFFGYDEEIEELVLPKTLMGMIPLIKGNIRKITVPESIRHIYRLDFVLINEYKCGKLLLLETFYPIGCGGLRI